MSSRYFFFFRCFLLQHATVRFLCSSPLPCVCCPSLSLWIPLTALSPSSVPQSDSSCTLSIHLLTQMFHHTFITIEVSMLASSHATNYIFMVCWLSHRNCLSLLLPLACALILSYAHTLHQRFKTGTNMWIHEDFPNMCLYTQAPQIYSKPAYRLYARPNLCGNCKTTSCWNTCSTSLQHMYPAFF